MGYQLLQGLGIIPEARRSQRIGPYEIAYMMYEAYGHRGTGKTLHYHNGSKRILVTRELGAFEFNPHDPTSVLFERCPNAERRECGIYYFDGRRARSSKVSDEQALYQPVARAVLWSPNGKSVALSGQYHVHLVNLAQPAMLDLSETLALRQGPDGRSVEVGAWSPDARKLSVIVTQSVDPVPPFINFAHDLFVVDAQTGAASYVATAEGRNWSDIGYQWLAIGDSYLVAAMPNGQGIGWKVFRKWATDLPPTVSMQWP